jgi:fluoride exporter
MLQIVYIGIFGLAGIFSRYGIDQLASLYGQSHPLFTLITNILGSFIAGVILGASPNGIDQPWKVGVIVGFCGGFTTFSGFSLQMLHFLQNGELGLAFALGIVSPILCLLGVMAGYFLFRRFFVSY